MMRVMHEADPYGFFLGRSGEPVDPVAFSKSIGQHPRDVRKLITELDRAGVFSRDSQDRIFSRRLVRDFARNLQSSGFGKDGADSRYSGDGGGNSLGDGGGYRVGHSQDYGGGSSRPGIYQLPDTRDTDSLRSSALTFSDWPKDATTLRGLAATFLAAFGNCFDPAKAEKHLPHYTAALATMRSRGVTIADAWDACAEARVAAGDRPLFGAAIKTAISFLPARSFGKPKAPIPKSLTPEGGASDYAAALESQTLERYAEERKHHAQ